MCFCVQLRKVGAGRLSHTLNLLVPTLGAVVLVTYGLCENLRNFVFGVLVPQYHYSYPVALSFGQVGASSPPPLPGGPDPGFRSDA